MNRSHKTTPDNKYIESDLIHIEDASFLRFLDNGTASMDPNSVIQTMAGANIPFEINLPNYCMVSDDDERSEDISFFEELTSPFIPDQPQVDFPNKWCRSHELPPPPPPTTTTTRSTPSMEGMINKLSATMIRSAKSRDLVSSNILPDLIRRGLHLENKKRAREMVDPMSSRTAVVISTSAKRRKEEAVPIRIIQNDSRMISNGEKRHGSQSIAGFLRASKKYS
ncbi:unnamed protein product [Cylindrotheca closterium]|uniref:Uncharacterized protein n=1 Tax=Cylindrotheca closterium TaxID=2856 RepID=A0AAD2CP22_9STRA|nr:unnamed protein product [Cylindrotheca closterium]